MSKPDARTVVPGQMVSYHGAASVPVSFVGSPDLSASELEELHRRIGAASGDGTVAQVLTPLLVSSLSDLDTVRVLGWLVGLLDARKPRTR